LNGLGGPFACPGLGPGALEAVRWPSSYIFV
jgi:hypothetical protein